MKRGKMALLWFVCAIAHVIMGFILAPSWGEEMGPLLTLLNVLWWFPIVPLHAVVNMPEWAALVVWLLQPICAGWLWMQLALYLRRKMRPVP